MMLVVSSSGSNKGLMQLKPALLFSNPLQYRYKIEETGDTFTSTKSNTKDAYGEYKFLKSVDGLTSELEIS